MSSFQIEKDHLKIVQEILKPFKLDVFVFGSRATGTAKKLSDLDLVIKSKISKENLVKIRSSFEDSNLPYKVDVIVWDEISAEFQNHIESDLIPFSR